MLDGSRVGEGDGEELGFAVGTLEGEIEGGVEGEMEGEVEGEAVGASIFKKSESMARAHTLQVIGQSVLISPSLHC